jgi:hypothetical protein
MVTHKGVYVEARRVREVLNRDAFRQIALYRPVCQPHFLYLRQIPAPRFRSMKRNISGSSGLLTRLISLPSHLSNLQTPTRWYVRVVRKQFQTASVLSTLRLHWRKLIATNAYFSFSISAGILYTLDDMQGHVRIHTLA